MVKSDILQMGDQHLMNMRYTLRSIARRSLWLMNLYDTYLWCWHQMEQEWEERLPLFYSIFYSNPFLGFESPEIVLWLFLLSMSNDTHFFNQSNNFRPLKTIRWMPSLRIMEEMEVEDSIAVVLRQGMSPLSNLVSHNTVQTLWRTRNCSPLHLHI